MSERSTDKTFDKFSGKSADESGAPSGQSGESGGDASGGKASAGRTGEGDVAATKAVGTVAGGRTSGWPEMTPPDLPPRPVPRAPITDVVPRRTLVIVAVVVALAVLGTVLALSFGGDDGASGSRSGDTKSAAAGKATPSSGKDEDSAASTENEQTEAASGTDASASGEAGTESGSGGSSGSGSGGDTSGSDSAAETTYKGSQGFRIGLPKGWKYQSTDAAGARFSGPDGQKLLVAWTSTPKNDPVADWKNQERYMTRSQYQRIRIEEVDYRDWKTADWEFTYTDGGTKYRSIDRGFVVNSQQGYALMYTAKASEWSSDLRKDTWRTFTKTFQPKS